LKDKVDLKSAILTTFDFEEELIKPLLDSKVPITLFEDKIKSNPTHAFKEDSAINLNKVNVTRYNKG
jgi:hypothetical protein